MRPRLNILVKMKNIISKPSWEFVNIEGMKGLGEPISKNLYTGVSVAGGIGIRDKVVIYG